MSIYTEFVLLTFFFLFIIAGIYLPIEKKIEKRKFEKRRAKFLATGDLEKLNK